MRAWPAAAAVLGLLAGTAHAQSAAGPVVDVDRQLFASFDGMLTHYNEHFHDGSPNDREHGWTPGFGVGASTVFALPFAGPLPAIYAGVSYHRQSGHLDYTGTQFDTGAPLSSTSGLITDDITGEIGPDFVLGPRLAILPVLQFGYHRWRRGLAQDQTETYHHVLAGAAVRANVAIAPRLVGTLRLGIAATVDPRIDIDFRGSYPQGLGGNPIYQAGAKLDYAIAPPLHLFVRADLSHFTYGRSRGSAFQDGGTIYEPDSTTTNTTLAGGVALGF